ncbi:acyl-CoA dehydrogenase family protein [Ammoniphilus sp. YIM 78166]|uniref:acyl-CoA dehydrogenase family protein n=1 Tax=Ammoniphilus sp. YIM 78166 TaxID=1644106 RepID=UPI0010700CC4|nr:acyl-CoA dehydrogenase family protein [Ammoniphilus sp. YIM 78166]
MALIFDKHAVERVLNKNLLPQVSRIDHEGLYPHSMLRGLGDSGAFALKNSDDLNDTIQLIENVGTRCATTAFIVWCHTIAIQLLAQSNNKYLKEKLLDDLYKGLIVGSTGLSNAMKFYAGMEPIQLRGHRINDGYKISGSLPFVSNLGPDHLFAIIFETDSTHRVLALVPCHVMGLSLTERKNLLGMNGTATYSCEFKDVLVPNEWILAEHADEFVRGVRAEFILKQTAVPLGIAQTSLESIDSLYKESEMNRYLPIKPEGLSQKIKSLRDQMYDLAKDPHIQNRLMDVMRLRLESTYLALETTQAEMLYAGSTGYEMHSHPSRRHRESLFFTLVTPTVKHLEKILT